MIDLEEFERRVGRSTAATPWDARPLIDRGGPAAVQTDAYRAVFEPRSPLAAPLRADAWQPFAEKAPHGGGQTGERVISGDFAAIEAGLLGIGRRDAGAAAERAERREPFLGDGFARGDFAAIETGMLDAGRGQAAPTVEAPLVLASVDDRSDHWHLAGDAVVPRAEDLPEEDVRSRLPLYVMTAVIVVGIAGVAASFGSRSAAPTRTFGAPEMEMAVAKPDIGSAKPLTDVAKVLEAPARSAAIIGMAPEPAPMALADKPEQTLAAAPAELEKESPQVAAWAIEAPAVPAADPGLAAEAAFAPPQAGAAAIEVPAPPAQAQAAVSAPAEVDVPAQAQVGSAAVLPSTMQGQAEQPSIAALIESQAKPASARPEVAAPRNDALAHATGAPLPTPRPAALGKASAAKAPSQAKTPIQAKAPSQAKAPVRAAAAPKPRTASDAGDHRPPAQAAQPVAARPEASVAGEPTPILPSAAVPADGKARAVAARPQPNEPMAFLQNAMTSIATTTDKLLEWGGAGQPAPRP
jgi:hypothetical protein